MKLFDPQSKEQNATMLAKHLPKGRVWSGGFDGATNLGKLILGSGVEFSRLQERTKNIAREMDINETSDLIQEWEKSVGLPDDCFGTNVDIEERKLQVLQKLSKYGGVQKAEDFVRVASVFGFDIRVTAGGPVGSFPLEFPLVFFDSARSATHTIFIEILNFVQSDVQFALEFPIQFSSDGTGFLKCIFDVLSPANVQVLFVPEGTV